MTPVPGNQLTSQDASAHRRPSGIRYWFLENRLRLVVVTISIILIIGITVAVSLVFINQYRLMIIKYGVKDKTPLDQLGSFIGGISLFFGALLVWIEANIITSRNAKIDRDMREAALKIDRDMREAALKNERDIANKEFQLREAALAAEQNNIATEQYISAVNSFRILYDEFWKEGGAVSKARRWIISEEEYNTVLKPILVERNNTGKHNKLVACKNEKMEIIDRFCSILVRIQSFTMSNEIQSLEEGQRALWVKILHGKYWINFIDENREDLHNYLKVHWKEMLEAYKMENEKSSDKTHKVVN